jgi:FtsH-binding integral membrane protein
MITDAYAIRGQQEGPAILASCLIGATTLLMLQVQPLLLGAMVQEGRLGMAGLGQVAGAEMIGLALAVGLAPRFMSGDRLRLKLALALALLSALNFAMPLVQSLGSIIAVRGAAGVLEGLALAACISVQMDSRQPERVNALFFAFVGVPAIPLGWVFPTHVFPAGGADAGFAVVGALTALAILAIRPLPPRIGFEPVFVLGSRGLDWLTPAVLLAIAAIVLQNAGNGGAWAYVERIGAQRELPAEAIATAFSASLAANVLVSLAVAWVAWRLPPLLTLIVGLLLHAAVTLWLAFAANSTSYVAATIGFSIFWAALLPFYVAVAVRLDSSRRFALILFGVGLGGIAIGPLITSLAVSENDVAPAFMVAAACFAVASLLFLGVAVASRRRVAAD